MKKSAAALPAIILLLSACGGSDPIGAQRMIGSGGMLFSDALSLTSTQTASLSAVQFPILARFNDANNRVGTVLPSGSVKYDGNILAQMGSGSTFLNGDLTITLDMNGGTGSGIVNGIAFQGHPTIADGLTSFTSRLAVNVTGISGSNVLGTITGEFSDVDAFDKQFSEEFIVDATFNSGFVNGSIGHEIVGVIDGTIDPESAPIETLKGVLNGKQDIFF